jgi:hypothetical protein
MHFANKSIGGNHEAIASGSVNALNTFSMGAVKTRCSFTLFSAIFIQYVFSNLKNYFKSNSSLGKCCYVGWIISFFYLKIRQLNDKNLLV